jgi:nitrite reductase/ring-hydroxylating ferredoxin subunit
VAALGWQDRREDDGVSNSWALHRVIWEARAYAAVLVGVIARAIATGRIVPLLFHRGQSGAHRPRRQHLRPLLLAEDDFALTDGLCTHAGTHLVDGHLEGGLIECPEHDGRFDVRTGEPKRRPATVPLQSYPVKVVDGRIIADLRSRLSSEAGSVGRIHVT